jgi:hypothetical protein
MVNIAIGLLELIASSVVSFTIKAQHRPHGCRAEEVFSLTD